MRKINFFIFSSCTKQQPSEPAVVTLSDAHISAQQQKNVFQVSVLCILTGIGSLNVHCQVSVQILLRLIDSE